MIFHFAAAQENCDGAVQQEAGEYSFKRIAVEVADQICGNSRPKSRGQFERHAETNVGSVALEMDGRTRR